MRPAEPFIFGIALIPRASARNGSSVEALLDLTLRSVRGQSDPDFRVVVAGHDRPRASLGDQRITFLEADWPVQEPGPDNADSGRKKRAIEDFVLAQGGGLLMLLDADDWVDVRLVEAARRAVDAHQVGGLIARSTMPARAGSASAWTRSGRPRPHPFDRGSPAARRSGWNRHQPRV